MPRLTKKKVRTFNLGKIDQRDEYEDLINDSKVSFVEKEEFVYDKRTGQPVITIWYEEYIK